jgi:hypothetical protein
MMNKKLDYPKVEGAYFSCWAESHPGRVAQVFIRRRELGDASPKCEICGAVMTYGRYTDQVDTGIVVIDPKTGIVKSTTTGPDVKKKVGKLLKLYGFKRVTIMRADGTVEEIE